MKKILLYLFSLCLSCGIYAQNTNSSTELLRQGANNRKAKAEAKVKLDKQEYWVGKVPVKNGKVTFEKKINVPGKSMAQVYNAMTVFAQNLVSMSEHTDVSQIALQEESQGKIIGSIQETMYFKRKKWEADFTEFYYQFIIDCHDGGCTLTLTDLQYRYEEEREIKGEYLKAEEWISDEAAFNKAKTKLLKEPGKFRRGTINRVNEIFAVAEKALN